VQSVELQNALLEQIAMEKEPGPSFPCGTGEQQAAEQCKLVGDKLAG
jgi:hypothetical protein